MLIIGCGNRQRGDDAAGILVAEKLSALGVEALLCSGDAAELMAAWSACNDVIVVDAVLTGASPGAVHVWDGRHPPLSTPATASTHGLGVGEAIALAQAMDRLPSRLRIYGIEGKNFGVGSQLSPEVQRAIELVVERIVTEVKAATR